MEYSKRNIKTLIKLREIDKILKNPNPYIKTPLLSSIKEKLESNLTLKYIEVLEKGEISFFFTTIGEKESYFTSKKFLNKSNRDNRKNVLYLETLVETKFYNSNLEEEIALLEIFNNIGLIKSFKVTKKGFFIIKFKNILYLEYFFTLINTLSL